MKYKIKSYHYDLDSTQRRLIFTIEEPNGIGESRKYAEEIISSLESWQNKFSPGDVKKITYAAKLDAKRGK